MVENNDTHSGRKRHDDLGGRLLVPLGCLSDPLAGISYGEWLAFVYDLEWDVLELLPSSGTGLGQIRAGLTARWRLDELVNQALGSAAARLPRRLLKSGRLADVLIEVATTYRIILVDDSMPLSSELRAGLRSASCDLIPLPENTATADRQRVASSRRTARRRPGAGWWGPRYLAELG